MNEILHDAVRHNNWATRRLIDFCREVKLTEDQLSTAPESGTYGSILATLNHFIASDAHYLTNLIGSRPEWIADQGDTDLDGLAQRAEATEPLWERLLSAPIDTERVIVVDDGENEVEAGVFIAQALNHGNLHREQVCATLAHLGIEGPDLQAWEYAWATGRLRQRSSQ